MLEAGLVGAVLVGLVEAIKRTGWVSSRYSALVSILLGVIVFGFNGGFNVEPILNGVIAGLTASGLYSGTKATILNR